MTTAPLIIVSAEHNTQLPEECGEARNPRNLVPEDTYEAQATGYQLIPFKKGVKIYVRFQLTSFGEFSGKELCGCFQVYQKYGPRSKFYKAWEVANGRRPTKRESLSPESLCGRVYKVKVKTVLKDEDGDEYQPHQQYSVVTKVLQLITGNPKPNTNYRLPTSPSINNQKRKGIEK